MRLAAFILLAASTAAAQPLAMTYRNTLPLPATALDQFGEPFAIAGLSGIAGGFFSTNSQLCAVMDNSNKVLTIEVAVAPDGTLTSAQIALCYSLAETRDFEGIVTSGSIAFLAEEGTPAIRSYTLPTGAVSETILPPPVFQSIRPNFGFESLSGRPIDGPFWTANEEALAVDGPISTASTGTIVRLLRFDGPGLTPGPQFAYITEPWHGASINGARSGVSDLLMLPDGRLLVLERSFAFNLAGFFQTRIYEVGFSGATDVSLFPGLISQTYTPVAKRLLHQGDHQNMEGLALGPQLGPGRYSLLGIVDDGDPISQNRLIAFEITGVGGPICYANCDGSTGVPVLSANDFQCYLNRFAAGDTYADCDGVGGLTPNDFNCFLNRFAAGCV